MARELTLAESATRAFEIAQRERYALAAIAAREVPKQPAHWFARTILRNVDVYGVTVGDAQRVLLTSARIGGLTLAESMNALCTADGTTIYMSLAVTEREHKRYLEWARTAA